MTDRLVDPWLVAVWPGMGGVAQIAGTHLVQKLGPSVVEEMRLEDFFDVRGVRVKNGLTQQGEVPKTVLYGWKNPNGRPDLLILLGEQQPGHQGMDYCRQVLDHAAAYGVSRVVTFAAMATPIHPTAKPRVFAVANSQTILDEVSRQSVEILAEGEVTGLNGVFLSVAAERDYGGVCLLGEFPYFASPTPNPKASRAVLDVFRSMSGIDVDLTDLDAQAQVMERQLTDILEKLQSAGEQASEFEVAGEFGETFEEEEEEEGGEDEEEVDEEPVELDASTQARIEELFAAAASDRSKALELKAELDRHGAFKQYEDRFLDLFKQAG